MASTPELRQYLIVTANYWAFTLTDGALRMLVVLHFYQLGYSPLQIAMLFIFYEFFGVVTNLVGGWLGARIGLNRTMNIGLVLQVIALSMLALPSTAMLTVPWVMAAQAVSGIAKDLNKMSAKSAIKTLVTGDQHHTLYRWVALLTGSKNTLKGVGFFLGAMLLSWWGFSGATGAMACVLLLVWLISLMLLRQDLGKASSKPKFQDIFSKSEAINLLSAARLFLFGARDVWFVVALPVYLASQLSWSHQQVGGFLALWIIGYGIVQAFAPKLTGQVERPAQAAFLWAVLLAACLLVLVLLMSSALPVGYVLVGGLTLFGVLFAINSSLHSFLIVRYANADGASMDVGFYYMANAMGRLLGTVLSGWVYQQWGLIPCLWVALVFVLLAAVISLSLPKGEELSAVKHYKNG
jgi:predicted MFS family arabinose efflux permease